MTEVRAYGRHAPCDRGRGESVGAHRSQPALEVLDRRVGDRASAERGELAEVAPIGVDRTRRAPGSEVEEEALDVGIVGGHGLTRFGAVDGAPALPLLGDGRGSL